MDQQHEQPKPSDISAEQTSNALVNRIRKLQWMGMEEEAGRLQKELALSHFSSANPVIGGAIDTD